MSDPRKILTANEKEGIVWKKIETYLQGKLESLRKKNDAHLSPEDTTALRGDINGIKTLLTLGEPAPTAEEVSAID